MNSKLLIGIVVIVILLIVLVIAGTSSKPNTNSTTTSTISTPYLVKVINVTDAQAIATLDGYTSKSYIVVYLNITYLGSGTFTLHLSDFELYTNEGVYQAETLEPPGIMGYFTSGAQLLHGNFVVGGIAFLVPSSAVPERLVYVNAAGQTYFNISLPKPNSYISFITSVLTPPPSDSSVVVMTENLEANIEGFNGQSFNVTLMITNNHFSTPVTVQGISLSPAFKFVANTNYEGLTIQPGQSAYITLTIYFPNESYYGDLNIYVQVT